MSQYGARPDAVADGDPDSGPAAEGDTREDGGDGNATEDGGEEGGKAVGGNDGGDDCGPAPGPDSGTDSGHGTGRGTDHGTTRGTGRPGRRVLLRRGWRLAVALAIFGALVRGTFWGTDMAFPFGPMSQYAFRTDPNGVIDSHYVDADTTEGRRIRIPLSHSGMSRAQLEGQLWKFLQDPSMLQQLADTQEARYPNEPHYVRLYVMRDRTELKDASATRRYTETMTQWEVR